MEIPVSSPSRDRWGLAAILLPIIAMMAYMISPFLVDLVHPGVGTFFLIASLVGILFSIPFGIGIAISGWKKDRRRVVKGIAGFVTGVVSCALVVVSSMIIAKKTREIQAGIQRQAAEAPSPSAPPVPD